MSQREKKQGKVRGRKRQGKARGKERQKEGKREKRQRKVRKRKRNRGKSIIQVLWIYGQNKRQQRNASE